MREEAAVRLDCGSGNGEERENRFFSARSLDFRPSCDENSQKKKCRLSQLTFSVSLIMQEYWRKIATSTLTIGFQSNLQR